MVADGHSSSHASLLLFKASVDHFQNNSTPQVNHNIKMSPPSSFGNPHGWSPAAKAVLVGGGQGSCA